jgi:hypothetical protein
VETFVVTAERLPHDPPAVGLTTPPDFWDSDSWFTAWFSVEGQLKADPLHTVVTPAKLEQRTQVYVMLLPGHE